jgi:hypothetical protein
MRNPAQLSVVANRTARSGSRKCGKMNASDSNIRPPWLRDASCASNAPRMVWSHEYNLRGRHEWASCAASGFAILIPHKNKCRNTRLRTEVRSVVGLLERDDPRSLDPGQRPL